ncbi:11266_t:CDS:2 [Diversispora eburnea]|uniref:11266_t:CDS:1 n=1 Tax=Diversispora eburnea TaxID=1213867 RepID=A0A9N8VY69_9GLOM|nr:11266_t:CDS:2 [Diversispora eburnea]
MTYGKDKISQVFYKSHHSSSKKAIDKLLSKSLAKSLKKRREQKKLKKLHLAKTKHKYHDRINRINESHNHNNTEIFEKSDSSDSNMTIDYVSDDSDIYPRSKNLSISKTDFGSDQITDDDVSRSNSTSTISSNSFARVMIDRGISDQSTIPQELNPIRIPSTPHLEWEDLIKNINDMNLNTSNLDNITLNIKWKSNPLEISHLQRFEFLHKIEAEVASLLRLTPVQYLTSKNTLLSASRRYKERMLPFRKSDAQKMLKMDVNKASKLWEFFRQAQWL